MLPPIELDRERLTRLAGAAMGLGPIEIMEWRVDPIHVAFNQTTGGLYRISGTGRQGDREVPWSVVLKVLHDEGGPLGELAGPASASYWKREFLIYGSGALQSLPGIRAPQCLALEEPAAGVAWIWLEDVAGGSVAPWSPARFRLAARRLGEFNGAYLTDRPIPATGHLSRDWLRAHLGEFEGAFTQIPTVRDHPLVSRCWPGGLLDRALDLWERRETLLSALDRLPQTFCHLDAFPRNLLVDDDAEEVVALDWSYAGTAAIGSELAPMVAASVCFFEADPKDIHSIDDAVFRGYCRGLRAAGWDGDPEQVRLGYTATASLHFGLYPLGVYVLDRDFSHHVEKALGHPLTAILDRWAVMARFLLDQGDEAHRLLRSHRRWKGGMRRRRSSVQSRHQHRQARLARRNP